MDDELIAYEVAETLKGNRSVRHYLRQFDMVEQNLILYAALERICGSATNPVYTDARNNYMLKVIEAVQIDRYAGTLPKDKMPEIK